MGFRVHKDYLDTEAQQLGMTLVGTDRPVVKPRTSQVWEAVSLVKGKEEKRTLSEKWGECGRDGNV